RLAISSICAFLSVTALRPPSSTLLPYTTLFRSCVLPQGRLPREPEIGRKPGGRGTHARIGVTVFLDQRGLGGDDLLAAVVTGSRHGGAQVDLARGRVGRQLLGGQRVVRTALATAGRGDTGVLHSHGIAPNSVELRVLVKPRSPPPVPFQGAFARRRGRPTSFSGPLAPRTGWLPAVLPRWPTRCGRPARCPGRPGPPAGRAPARPPPGPAASACRPPARAAARTRAAARLPAPRRGSG